ncbi:MAG: PVC-type heme-binding CxxCH protein, partial [Planctomycetota bacterium]
DADGRADDVKVFYEGFTHAMDLAMGRDGWLYLATRNQIFRLRDTNRDDVADQIELLVDMQTASQYPHNGLSGLAFDFNGNLYFGLGENRSQPYAIKGSDGAVLYGDHGIGCVFRCAPDGSELRRVAQGFWNPFGVCVDAMGTVLLTDNDPGDRSPCRLIHVVEGGDYGYERRYVYGLHPLVSWDGELAGTLPMIRGTGEAPCAILPYESDALPEDYRGDLLIASWSDYRIERYRLSPNGASFKADMQVVVEGDRFFRPVDMDTASDGTVYVSDWADGLYPVHGKGRIWRIRPKKTMTIARPNDSRKGLFSPHRPLREKSARQLAVAGAVDQHWLIRQVSEAKAPKVAAASLMALIEAGVEVDLHAIARSHSNDSVRHIAATALLDNGADPTAFDASGFPPITRAHALRAMSPTRHQSILLQRLIDPDPFIHRAAIVALASNGPELMRVDIDQLADARQRAGLLVAMQRSAHPAASKRISAFLKDPDPAVRLRAVKWVADERLQQYQQALENGLNDPSLTPDLFMAHLAAIEQLELEPLPDFTEKELAGLSSREFLPKIDFQNPTRLLAKVVDTGATPTLRRLALRLMPPDHKGLNETLLTSLLRHDDNGLRLEALRTLRDAPTGWRLNRLAELAADTTLSSQHRAEAVSGLQASTDHKPLLMKLATGADPTLRSASLASLVGTVLNKKDIAALKSIVQSDPSSAEAVARLTHEVRPGRPGVDNIGAWVELLGNGGDPEAGRRVFFGASAACSRCHRHTGRGVAVGPDLTSLAGAADPAPVIESILHPSRNIAPQYRPWLIRLNNGKAYIGIGLTKGGTSENYLDATGQRFRVVTQQIVHRQELTTSLMPAGLHEILTITELRDLVAFLHNP